MTQPPAPGEPEPARPAAARRAVGEPEPGRPAATRRAGAGRAAATPAGAADERGGRTGGWLDPARVAGAFGLGEPRGPLVAVPGAWSNRLWRLETERGEFAVKELRGSAAAPGWRRRLRDAMAVERAAWAAGTVPMARPVAAAAGGWLAEVATTSGGHATLRCHRWVPGTPAAGLAPSPALAADVGRSLAAIHALGLPAPATTADGVAPLPLAAWERLVAEARRARLAWAGELAGLAPLVRELAERLEALRRAGRRMLRSHRDLDPKNAVVRPDARVALLDWDYAGPVPPAAELLGTALSFAGGAAGEPDAACVGACVHGYLDAGGRPQAPDLLDAAFLHREGLDWLWRNVDRCLGRRLDDPGDLPLARRLAPRLVGSFPAEVATVDRWAGRLLADL
jgi:Phosphotransferase enzyme family